MKPASRIILALAAILAIYLLFPILIVPSPLPPVQTAEPDALTIYQLEPEKVPTVKDSWHELQARHRAGMQLIIATVKKSI